MKKLVLLLVLLLSFTAGAMAWECWDGTSGAVSWWTLDNADNIANNVTDVCGWNHGWNDTAQSGKTGVWNEAFEFVQAGSDKVDVADDPSLTATNFSVCFWTKHNGGLGGVNTEQALSKWAVANYEWGFFWSKGAQTFRFTVLDSTAANDCTAVLTSNPLVVGTWYHFCGTWNDPLDNCTLYVNGTYNISAANPGLLRTDGTANVTMGATGTGADFWNGTIDEVSFYNYTLASVNVTNLFLYNNVSGVAGGGPPALNCTPPAGGIGNWNISAASTEVCYNEVINITGNLNVKGTLILNNSNLTMNLTGDRTRNITVWAGGNFKVLNYSWLKSNSTWGYNFLVRNTASLNMSNSTIAYVGRGPGWGVAPYYKDGLWINASDTFINYCNLTDVWSVNYMPQSNNSKFYNNWIYEGFGEGIATFGVGGLRIINNTIQKVTNGNGIGLFTSPYIASENSVFSNMTIHNNTIFNCKEAGISHHGYYHNDTITNNTIWDIFKGVNIAIYGMYNNVSYNKISNTSFSVCGIGVYWNASHPAQNNTIHGNTLYNPTNGTGYGIRMHRTDVYKAASWNTITNNTISNISQSIWTCSNGTSGVTNNLFYGNIISNGSYGIWFDDTATGNNVTNNQFYGCGTEDIRDDDTNIGNLNWCNTWTNWNDTSAPCGCWKCSNGTLRTPVMCGVGGGVCPNDPILNHPGNGATQIGNSTTLNVTVTDPDGDAMNVSFFRYLGYGYSNYSKMASGLGDIGVWSMPVVFNMSGTYYLIAGSGHGVSTGYNWTGNKWQADPDIVNGIGPLGQITGYDAFNMSGTYYLIAGRWDGFFHGYNWTGAAWQTDEKLWQTPIPRNGIDVGEDASPAIFNLTGSLHMITGSRSGSWFGYTWNDGWTLNVSLIVGLPNIDSATPDTYWKNGTLYLTHGCYVCTTNRKQLQTYEWNGTGWEWLGSTAPGNSFYKAPTHFSYENTGYAVIGSGGGTFEGGIWDNLLSENLTIASGANVVYEWTGLTNATTYKWYTSACDDNCTNFSSVWSFTTGGTPIITLNSPADGATSLPAGTIQLNITVTDPDANNMNVTFINASDGTTFCLNLTVASGANVVCNITVVNSMTYNWSVNATDGNWTAIGPTWTFSTLEAIWVNAYDEQNPLTNLTYNVTIWNSTHTFTSLNNAMPFQLSNSSAPTGNITIEVSKDGWSTRRYYYYYHPTGSGIHCMAYLLLSGQGVTSYFMTVNTEWVPLPNSTITFYRLFPNASAYVQVAQRQTDSFGKTFEYLDPYTTYLFHASATGYGSRSGYITPMATTYNILFGTEATYINPDNINDFFWALIYPTSSGMVNYTTDKIVFEINDPRSALNWFALNFTYANGSNFWGYNVTGSGSGGLIEIKLSTILGSLPQSPMTRWHANGSWDRDGTAGYVYRQFRRHGGYTDTTTPAATLVSVASMIGKTSGSPGAISIIAIFVILITAGILNKTMGFGGGIVALLIGGILAIFGWIPMALYIVAAGIALIIMFTLTRRF